MYFNQFYDIIIIEVITMAKARIFNIMQYENHPETGEPLLNEETIITALAHRTIKRWAYIRHDQDVYSALDEEQNPDHIAGQYKPPHWHIVIEMGSNATEVNVIARWLKIPENFIEIAKGAGAFLDCCKYLTHEDTKQQLLGKRLYEDSAVKANFPFRDELDKRAERQVRYGRDLNEKDAIRNEVLYRGMTLKTVVERYPIAYQNDITFLQKCRLEYLMRIAPMPNFRINYYIEGKGGIGKNLASKALARVLNMGVADDECYFEVGGQKVSFEGYDGQPVIIWNDQRAESLIQQWGRGEVFDIFDSHPTNARHNVKYGSIRLINRVNIVNGIQPYKEFLDQLAGAYFDYSGEKAYKEDPNQARRRFPIILCLHEEEFDVLLNRGVADGTREFEQYYQYLGVQGSFAQVAQRLEGPSRQRLETLMLDPAVRATDRLKLQEAEKISDPNMIPAEFLNYGMTRQEPELPGMPPKPDDPFS